MCNTNKDVYLLANVSLLRKIGTTTYFRTISELNITGAVHLKDGYYLKFRTLELAQGSEPLPKTITNLLESIRVSTMDIQQIKEVVDKENTVRAELEVSDYRRNSNAKYFSVEIMGMLEMVGKPQIDFDKYYDTPECIKDIYEKEINTDSKQKSIIGF